MKGRVIGIDLDNTLISYDRLFHTLALEQGLIPAELAPNKTEVRDFLRRAGKEPAWTALQGLGYGRRIREAEIFPDALDFLREGRKRGWQMHIVSHKTGAPIVGEAVDLHEAARGWLESKAIHAEIGLPRENVWLRGVHRRPSGAAARSAISDRHAANSFRAAGRGHEGFAGGYFRRRELGGNHEAAFP
jgi:hypothetical protein